MNSVYAVTSNLSVNTLRSIRLFSSLDSARKELEKISKERKNKVGVEVIKDEDDIFSFLIGWDGCEVIFSIVEIPVE